MNKEQTEACEDLLMWDGDKWVPKACTCNVKMLMLNPLVKGLVEALSSVQLNKNHRVNHYDVDGDAVCEDYCPSCIVIMALERFKMLT